MVYPLAEKKDIRTVLLLAGRMAVVKVDCLVEWLVAEWVA